jgi:hypothetical protein
MNQARLGVAFSAPSFAGFFTEKLAAAEKVRSSPCPRRVYMFKSDHEFPG